MNWLLVLAAIVHIIGMIMVAFMFYDLLEVTVIIAFGLGVLGALRDRKTEKISPP